MAIARRVVSRGKVAVYTRDVHAKLSAVCPCFHPLVFLKAQPVHAGFYFEVHPQSAGGGAFGSDVTQRVGPAAEVFYAVYLWFEVPFDEVSIATGVGVEDEKGTPHPAFSQRDAFFDKGHGQAVDAKPVQFYSHSITGTVGECLDHAHDGLIETLSKAVEVVCEFSEVQIQDSGVGVDFEGLGDALETKGPRSFDQNVPPFEIGQVATVEKPLNVAVVTEEKRTGSFAKFRRRLLCRMRQPP